MIMHDIADRFEHKYYGPYRAQVVDIDDPKQLGRIRLFVPVVFGENYDTGEQPSSGWAWPLFGGGGSGTGTFFLPVVGDTVWCQFEEGDIERPTWTHGAWTMRGGVNNVPAHNQELYDSSDNKLRGIEGVIPTSQFGGDYTKVKAITTKHHRIEFDDTTGAERLLIEHKSGARYEFLPDGTVHQITNGNKVEAIVGGEKKTVGGAVDTTIYGTSETTTKKTRTVTDESDLEYINVGGATYSYAGPRTTTVGTEIIQVNGSYTKKVLGSATSTSMGNSSESCLGDYSNVILGTARWVIANSNGLVPGESMVMHQMGMGDIAIRNGLDPLDLVNNTLLLRNPIPALRAGLADVVLQAVAIMALKAPLVVVGPTGVIDGTQEPVARAISLIAWLTAHIHATSTGPSSPPIIPPPATILSASLWAT